MKRLTLGLIAALGASAAWATTTINSAYAPSGTHVQSGTPSCEVNDYVVTCSSYDMAGVGNTNATATLEASYKGTVICTNPGGNVAPGQTQYPTLTTSSGKLSPKNGRMSVPSLSSTTDRATIEEALKLNTSCPNGKWKKDVQQGTLALVGFTYKLSFTGYPGAYMIISG